MLTDSNMRTIREHSHESMRALGIESNADLPFLDPVRLVRGFDEQLDRLLCMHLACFVANIDEGGPHALAIIDARGLASKLTKDEADYISKRPDRLRTKFTGIEEALWAMTWAWSLHEDMDFSGRCDPRLAGMLPNPFKPAEFDAFVAKCTADFRPRPAIEIASALDLAYCLHNSLVVDFLAGRPPRLEPWVVIERRRALEWVTSAAGWDDVRLDT